MRNIIALAAWRAVSGRRISARNSRFRARASRRVQCGAMRAIRMPLAWASCAIAAVSMRA